MAFLLKTTMKKCYKKFEYVYLGQIVLPYYEKAVL